MGSYEDSGFDSFLSRSIDDLQQVNLDSQGPYSTATAYDRSQLSGSMGDKFNMGGINMSAKDSQMTVNNGAIIVNDADTASKINASSGNITYYDSTGNLVIQEGLLADNTTGIKAVDRQGRTIVQLGRQIDTTTNVKFFDNSGVGLAQFGGFPDNTTALKVAKSGFEVSTATNDQLIFNSSQNIPKIALTGTGTILVTNTGFYDEFTATIPHGLSSTPFYVVYITPPNGSGLTIQQTPYYIYTYTLGTAIAPVLNAQVVTWVDSDNLTIDIIAKTSISNFVGTWTYRYYLMQETAI